MAFRFASLVTGLFEGAKEVNDLVEQRQKIANNQRFADAASAYYEKMSQGDDKAPAPDVTTYPQQPGGQAGTSPPPAAEAGADEWEAYIRNKALEKGIDPDIAVQVARTEGLGTSWQSNFSYNGQREKSYGDFQLNVDRPGSLGSQFKKEKNLDPSDPANRAAMIDYSLDYASKYGWTPWNGAKRAGIDQWAGIGKFNQKTVASAGESAGQEYGAATVPIPPPTSKAPTVAAPTVAAPTPTTAPGAGQGATAAPGAGAGPPPRDNRGSFSLNSARVVAQNGQSYDLTPAQADQYYGFRNFQQAQNYLKTLPPTLAPKTPRTTAGSGGGFQSALDPGAGGDPIVPPDRTSFANRYNTQLSPEQEQQYQQWSASSGRDPSRDNYDYDMRGAFLSGATQAANGHYPDTFKKPNHPTFSTQSRYHGVEGYTGGRWAQNPSGNWTFTPGPTNLQMYGPQGLQDYFKRVEPNSQLAF